MKEIKFCHPYYKLEKPEFTTIRGKSWMKKFKVGDMVRVGSPKLAFSARIIHMKLQRINTMDIAFVNADASYPGHEITSHLDFISLLNSFRAPAWGKVSVEDEMTVLTLLKI